MKTFAFILVLILSIPMAALCDNNITVVEQQALIKLFHYQKPYEIAIIFDKSPDRSRWYANLTGCACSKNVSIRKSGNDLNAIVSELTKEFNLIKCD